MNDAGISSMRAGKFLRCASYLTVSLMGVMSQAAFSQTAPKSGSSNQGIEEIIVTAQKREQNLQDVPVAVTALSTQMIENAQIRSFSDLGRITPNLTVIETGTGSIPTMFLRGFVGSSILNGVDAAVATYVDGVYHTRGYALAAESADIERVEVLRGPQGTLYGRNAPGGAINLILAGPKGEAYARQELTYGNFGRLRAKVRVDLPRFGAFSIAGSFVHDEIDGSVRNTAPKLVRNFALDTRGYVGGDRTTVNSLGARNSESGFLAVRYAPEELPFTAEYRFTATDAVNTASESQILGFPNTGPGAIGGLIFALQPLVGGEGAVSLNRLDPVYNGFTTPELLKTWSHSLNLKLELPGGFSVQSITGYHGFTLSSVYELGSGGRTVDAFGGSGQPLTLYGNASYEKSNSFSQELQVNYDSDAFDAIGGLYYSRDHVLSVSRGYVAKVVPLGDVPAGTSNFIVDANAKNKSIAGYLQGTGHLTQKVDLIIGARYTKDYRRTDQFFNTIPDFAKNFDNLSWTATLSYRPTDNQMFYAKAGTGYRSGGVFNGQAFDPEKTIAYELGSKLDMMDRRLRLNTALFYSQTDGLQVGQFTNAGVLVFQNAAKSHAYGGEVELTFLPVRNATITANYGYTKTDILEQFENGVDIAATLGNGRAPKHNLNVGLDYAFPAFANGVEPSFNIMTNWQSKTDILPVPGRVPADVREAVRDNSFWNISARATLAKIPLAGPKAKLSVWGRNLLDKKKLADSNDLGLVVTGVYNRGRTYGVDVSLEF